MRQELPLMLVAALSGCAAAVAPQAVQPLRVTGAAAPLRYDEGLQARRIADATCGPKGVRTSTRDRHEAGAWIFVEGCA